MTDRDFDFFLLKTEYEILPYQGLFLFLYGLTRNSDTVCLVTNKFYPYFYIRKPETWANHHYEQFREALNEELQKKEGKGRGRHFREYVLDISIVRDYVSLYTYCKPEEFVKVTVAYPALVRICRNLLEYPYGCTEQGYRKYQPNWWPPELPPPVNNPYRRQDLYGNFPHFFDIFEANVDYTLRFQIDHKIKATSWITVKGGTWKIIDPKRKFSRCDIEIRADEKGIGPSMRHDATQLPPFRIYVYDIECEPPETGEFPSSKTDRILQISYMKIQENKDIKKGVHMIEEPDYSPDILHIYPNEKELLKGFSFDLVDFDPAIMVTFNGKGFDNKYILDRIAINGIMETAGELGKRIGVFSTCRTVNFDSSAFKTVMTDTYMPGRLQIDVLEECKRGLKENSYSLGALSQKFLGFTKLEMDHKKIREYQKTKEGRGKICRYAVRDVEVTYELLKARKILYTRALMAVTACLDMNDIEQRGQQIRLFSIIHHATKNCRTNPSPVDKQNVLEFPFLIPVIPSYQIFEQSKYKGATVKNPDKQLHTQPIATLDFESLYPSIIIAYNMCYTTYVTREQIEEYGLIEGVHYTRVLKFHFHEDGTYSTSPDPEGHAFLLASYKKGLLPTILENLLVKRREVKAQIKKTLDPRERDILDSFQLALKLNANAGYGLTGTGKKGMMPFRPIAETTTYYGRMYIELIAHLIEHKFCKKNGYPFDITTVYGDTVISIFFLELIFFKDSSFLVIFSCNIFFSDLIYAEIHQCGSSFVARK